LEATGILRARLPTVSLTKGQGSMGRNEIGLVRDKRKKGNGNANATVVVVEER